MSEQENHSVKFNDQRLTSQRRHSASTDLENHSMQVSNKLLMYQRSLSAYEESHAVLTIPPSKAVGQPMIITHELEDTEKHNGRFTNHYSSLPTTHPIANSPSISHSYGQRCFQDQASKSPLYQHHHESDNSAVPYNIPLPQMVTSNNVSDYNTAQHSNSAPQLTVREADEYLSYQVSCMDRVISQLMNPNNSDNLQSNFMQTLKEQMIKTDNYIRNLPFLLRNVGNPMMRIECQLDKLLTSDIRVTHGDRQALDEVIYRLRNTIGN